MALRCPVELYEYQKSAIRCWMESGYCGFFEMATGTGKTITALATAVEKFQMKGKGILIVLYQFANNKVLMYNNSYKRGDYYAFT
jgi:superfamily II DNA or RNA helicase